MRRVGVFLLTSLVLTAANLVVGANSAGATATDFVRPSYLSPGPAPSASVEVGAVPAEQGLNLSIVLSPSHGPALESLLHNQNDPSSPEYHHWLSAGQFEAEFGPSIPDVTAVESWLRGEGLTPTKVTGFTVQVTGTAGTVTGALGTTLERYRSASGSVGFKALETPQIPQSLSNGEVQAILGLNTIDRLQPQSSPSPTIAPQVGHSVQSHADGLTPCAAAVSEAGSSFDTMDQLGAAYGIGSLLADGQNGHGETIGVYELATHSQSDVAAYESCFGLQNAISTVQVDGGGGPVGGAATGEADLDIEQAVTQAPSASIISYEGPDTTTQAAYDVWNQMVQSDAAQVISTSWGECESAASSDGSLGAFTTLFEQAASQGQTIFAASGDSGSEGCFAQNGSTAEQVWYPASDPWVTAVGGTFLYANGVETAWNWCDPGSLSCANGYGGVAAGGGGQSQYEPRPASQPNIVSWPSAQPCGQSCREVPDISANAGEAMVIYSGGTWTVSVGTSFAAPLLAGLVADRNNGCTATAGLWAPALYGLYDQGAYGTAFTDITSLNIDMTGSTGGAYPATAGYDAATGIGSPLAAGLSCPEVTSVGPGPSGAEVTVHGLGLEHATISFGGSPARVVSANATQASVIVPNGSGTVTVSGTSVLGSGTQTTSFTYVSQPQRGYWLVGSDGGIFTFGSAQFYGSTGSLHLQRPVVGITPTAGRRGYWLDASDGGVFAFGDAGFDGSIPGLGLHPAGSGLPNSLNAAIVGMVPSADGGGYFMVASDGGVFAFGDAKFAGSCPGIGGCSGAAVAVMPDASGNGYWVVTATGNVYTFGDASYLGAPGHATVTSAVATPDGRGYWVLLGNGEVFGYGDSAYFGAPQAAFNGFNPATAIFATSDGGGYWVSSALGVVFNFGDAPGDGGMSGTHLNGAIIAGTGF